jgi:hypothetical protein
LRSFSIQKQVVISRFRRRQRKRRSATPH